jgi:hypothetical protein
MSVHGFNHGLHYSDHHKIKVGNGVLVGTFRNISTVYRIIGKNGEKNCKYLKISTEIRTQTTNNLKLFVMRDFFFF